MTDLIASPEVRQYLGGSVPPEAQAQTLSRHARVDPSDDTWLVEITAKMRGIGLAFLSHHKDEDSLELSYQLPPSAWGQGFGTEASLRLRDYALNDLSCQALVAETQVANLAS